MRQIKVEWHYKVCHISMPSFLNFKILHFFSALKILRMTLQKEEQTRHGFLISISFSIAWFLLSICHWISHIWTVTWQLPGINTAFIEKISNIKFKHLNSCFIIVCHSLSAMNAMSLFTERGGRNMTVRVWLTDWLCLLTVQVYSAAPPHCTDCTHSTPAHLEERGNYII